MFDLIFLAKFLNDHYLTPYTLGMLQITLTNVPDVIFHTYSYMFNVWRHQIEFIINSSVEAAKHSEICTIVRYYKTYKNVTPAYVRTKV